MVIIGIALNALGRHSAQSAVPNHVRHLVFTSRHSRGRHSVTNPHYHHQSAHQQSAAVPTRFLESGVDPGQDD